MLELALHYFVKVRVKSTENDLLIIIIKAFLCFALLKLRKLDMHFQK